MGEPKPWPGFVNRKNIEGYNWVDEETSFMHYNKERDSRIAAEADLVDKKRTIAELQETLRETNRKCREQREAIKNRDWGYE